MKKFYENKPRMFFIIGTFIVLVLTVVGILVAPEKEVATNEPTPPNTAEQAAAYNKLATNWGTVKSVSQEKLVLTRNKVDTTYTLNANTTIKLDTDKIIEPTQIKKDAVATVTYDLETKKLLNVFLSGGSDE